MRSITTLFVFVFLLLLSGCTESDVIQVARSGDVAGLEKLIARKADLNAKDSEGRTALQVAIMCGNKMMFRRLLEAGADPTKTDRNGTSAIHYAADVGQVYWIREAVEHGGNPNCLNIGIRGSDYARMTPIFYALMRNNADAAIELIKLGANVNHVSQCGGTPLATAMAHRMYRPVIEMLKSGGDPHLGTVTIFDNGWMSPDYVKTLRTESEVNDYLELRTLLIERGDLEPD